jgi:pseudaminic acid synthase
VNSKLEKLLSIFSGSQDSPFIIAEMSGNHNKSIERALEIVSAAADSGADAIKLQTFTPDSMTLDIKSEEFLINNPESIWFGEDLYSLYSKAQTPWEWHKPIFEFSNKKGLLCFSSPFDEEAVDFLEELGVPAYKIASFECIDLPLIKKVSMTGKPVIISTGMASINEISEAVDMARTSGCKDLAILKCTSTYPAPPENTNLLTIPHMKKLFGCEVGLSDHTMGFGVSVASIAFGTSIIEKHFTLDRLDGGVDSSFSLEPLEFKNLVIEANRAWKALGKVQYGAETEELDEKNRLRRRSIYIAKDLEEGELLNSNNLRRVRPGHGLPPKYYDSLLGKKVIKAVKKGTPMSWDLVE